jgi:hypothetical protein
MNHVRCAYGLFLQLQRHGDHVRPTTCTHQNKYALKINNGKVNELASIFVSVARNFFDVA